MWQLLKKYYPTLIAVLLITLGVYTCNNNRTDIEYVEIMITQTNKSEIRAGTRGRPFIQINAKEHPNYRFLVRNVTLQSMWCWYSYENNVQPGDTLIMAISRDEYEAKIARSRPLRFMERAVNYRFIPVYGLRHQNRTLLAVRDVERARGDNSVWVFLFFAGFGCWFLYMQVYDMNKKKKSKNIFNNETAKQN